MSELSFIPPHVASDFCLWLWWYSETNRNKFKLLIGGQKEIIEVFVDDKISFRMPNDSKVYAVMTGENASTALESKAALVGGKVIQDLSICIRRDEKNFVLTLKGGDLLFHGLHLPQQVDGGGEEELYDRMFLYEETYMLVSELFKKFSVLRSIKWENTLSQIQEWAHA